MTTMRLSKKAALAAAACLMSVGSIMAQSDPVIMKVNGKPVTRSEFEYSYNKNNSDGVIDKKTVAEYVDLFINYKLKVADAEQAQLDTLSSFKEEFAMYRDQQVMPMLVTDDDMLAEARVIYQNTADQIGPDGMIKCSHILLQADQQAPKAEWDAVEKRADSLLNVLRQGADFAELAKQYSQDPGSARQGGQLPYVARGRFVPEFDEAAFKLQPGELSPVVKTAYGYHIIKMDERKQFEPFEYHKDAILQFMEQRNLRDNIGKQKVDSIIAHSAGTITKQDYLAQKADELSANDPELKNLIREYHDGLLLFEMGNRLVWDKGAKDEKGLANYFKKHKKKYAWSEPRFKGMAFHVKDEADHKAVPRSVKKLPFDQWAEKLRTTFNGDSIIRIRVEKGIFKMGDNALVDSLVFKKDTTVTKLKDYPIDDVYGKVLKKGPEDYTDVRGLVVADYQEQLEKEWVAALRKKYTWEVDEEVLKTVNNHD